MNTEVEIWKTIPDYENYQVSDLGNIKSLNYLRSNKSKLLKPGICNKGYKIVVLSKFGKSKTFKLHKLIAITFLNHKPCGYELVVDHIDNNKLNNNLSNLQIITSRENLSKDKKGVSKYTGVSYFKATNKWVSNIYKNGKYRYLGYFDNELDAHLAYKKALYSTL